MGSIKDISPSHWRNQAIVKDHGNNKTLLINSYFPVDKMTLNAMIVLPDLEESLQTISLLIRNTYCNRVIVTGDLNCDFSRNTNHTRAVSEFSNDLNLSSAWNTFPIDFSHSSERDGRTFISTRDHFLSTDSEIILDAGVIYVHENMSDHELIFCILKESILSMSSADISERTPKPSWRLATIGNKEEYIALMNSILENIAIPTKITDCKNLHCNIPSHIEAIDWLAKGDPQHPSVCQ